jgi:hypothetical protein
VLYRLLVHDAAGVIDQAVDQENVRAVHSHLRQVAGWDVARYRDVRADAGGGGIGGGSRTSIPRTGQCDFGNAQLLRPRDGGGHATRLEAAGRVVSLVLDAHMLADAQQRRHSLPQRHDIRRLADRQQLAIPPHVPRAAAENVRRDRPLHRRQVVSCEEDLAAAGADVMKNVGIECTVARSALEPLQVTRPA